MPGASQMQKAHADHQWIDVGLLSLSRHTVGWNPDKPPSRGGIKAQTYGSSDWLPPMAGTQLHLQLLC